jgi:sugar O-acyltransferase (sialic acid O-acetyltransferase NeuD family)
MAARPLLFVGAGGLARETLAAVRAGARSGPVRSEPGRSEPGRWDPVGMLDDDPARHGSDVDGVPVLGGTDTVHTRPDALVVLCVANARDPGGRARVAARLGLPDDRYATVVHPAASVAAGVRLGVGSILLAGCVVTAPQAVGRHVVAMPQVLLTHDDEVGDFVTLAGQAGLAGGVRVGAAAYIGAGAKIREGVSIGAGAVVGMGAVVLTDVPAGEVWAGSPARFLRTAALAGAR